MSGPPVVCLLLQLQNSLSICYSLFCQSRFDILLSSSCFQEIAQRNKYPQLQQCQLFALTKEPDGEDFDLPRMMCPSPPHQLSRKGKSHLKFKAQCHLMLGPFLLYHLGRFEPSHEVSICFRESGFHHWRHPTKATG